MSCLVRSVSIVGVLLVMGLKTTQFPSQEYCRVGIGQVFISFPVFGTAGVWSVRLGYRPPGGGSFSLSFTGDTPSASNDQHSL